MFKLITAISLMILFAIYGIVNYFIIYHLRSFAVKDGLNRKMIVVSVIISASLIATAIILFYKIPWENFSIPTY